VAPRGALSGSRHGGRRVIIRRSLHPGWLSNTWLVADRPGGSAVLVDTGAPVEPILAAIGELRVTVTHALCTHHHIDHIAHSGRYRDRLGCLVSGHGAEKEMFGRLDLELTDGQLIESGGLSIRCLHIPGHTRGQLAFVANDACVFTGDTLFAGSVGGTRAPGHTTFEDLRRSIMEVLMRLSAEMEVHPGHAELTTIGREWEANPFIRLWRNLDQPGTVRCIAGGQEATLLLRARDYDGGTKCQVRFDDGREEILPGSIVQDEGSSR
jgi:glyoxylase-like metal-dependent hydrolase (beta-lactamase superfamily II)